MLTSLAQGKIKKFIGLLHDFDFLRIVLHLSHYLPGFFLQFNYVYLLSAEQISGKTKSNPGLQIRRVTQGDVEQLTRIVKKEVDFQERLHKGCGFLAEMDATLAGFLWLSFEKSYFEQKINYSFLMPDGFFYYDAYVFPQFRAQGIWNEMIGQALSAAKTLGLSKIYCTVDFTNQVSLFVHFRYCFKIEKRIFHLVLLGWHFHFILNQGGRKPLFRVSR